MIVVRCIKTNYLAIGINLLLVLLLLLLLCHVLFFNLHKHQQHYLVNTMTTSPTRSCSSSTNSSKSSSSTTNFSASSSIATDSSTSSNTTTISTSSLHQWPTSPPRVPRRRLQGQRACPAQKGTCVERLDCHVHIDTKKKLKARGLLS